MEDSDRVCAKAGVPSLDLEKPVEDPDKVVRGDRTLLPKLIFFSSTNASCAWTSTKEQTLLLCLVVTDTAPLAGRIT